MMRGDLLRPEFPGVNHKRVYRLYRAADLPGERVDAGLAVCSGARA